MDYNSHDQNNQYDDSQWNRWNSNASHSSYYNQPTHNPYGRAFIIASLVCGMLSVTIGCCGLSIPVGALGILFAILARRKGKRMSSSAKIGLIFSITGFIVGIGMAVYSLIAFPMMLKNEAYREQFNTLFRASTGLDFEEYLDYLEEYYGITFTE